MTTAVQDERTDSQRRRHQDAATPTTTSSCSVPQDAPLLSIAETNKLFSRALQYSINLWVALVSILYYITPPEDLVFLSDSERMAATIAFFSLLTATVLMVMPLTLHRRSLGPLMWAALTTQSIAIVTNFLLAFCPVVVRIDTVTHSPVYLIRWCEWIPTAGLMTFLCEGVAIKKQQQPLHSGENNDRHNDVHAAVLNSVAQTLSCLTGGFVCAYCQNVYWWSLFMTASVVSWSFIFPRAIQKRRDFRTMRYTRANSDNPMTDSYLQHEKRDRLRFSYRLILTCSMVWTMLVVLYCVNAYIYRVLPANHRWKKFAPAMIVDTFFDVVAKALYMRWIADVHYAVFDNDSRAMRQLTELRGLMTILWDTSSDVIVVSIKDENGNIISILSPALLDLLQVELPVTVQGRHSIALMIEAVPKSKQKLGDNPQEGEEWGEITKAQYVDTSEAPYRGWTHHTILEQVDRNSFAATAAASFAAAAWARSSFVSARTQGTMPSDWHLRPYSFVTLKGDDRKTEIKVSNYGVNAIIGVIRDVTERFRWYEAERRAHAEVIRRQQDAQSQTRFVRHEVKNGLLAGIELCDSLRNEIDAFRQASGRLLQSADGTESGHAVPWRASLSEQSTSSLFLDDSTRDNTVIEGTDGLYKHVHNASSRITDLDMLLHEVLETVLHEAMARDVIHEVYEPRSERLDVLGVLSSSVSTKSGKSDRFPIRCLGELPFVQMDSQLLKYIHRNAISNATKYGKVGGNVDTVLSFDAKQKILTMSVINEPGENQEEIRKLSPVEYNRVVFSQGTTLHGNRQNVISSGDGAWIMQKCAKTMGGTCSISFEEDVTVFSFSAPVEPLLVASDVLDAKKFEVPSSTIGIAVDDSKIQRKLLSRILTYTGIKSENSHILGETPAEVMGLQGLLLGLLDDNPDSKLLVLIDENLDYCNKISIDEDITLSGSIVMQEILRAMTPAQEQRVLALVRSANDSTTDVQTYIERTHGFFPKAPMQKDRVREIICPLWVGKFLSTS